MRDNFIGTNERNGLIVYGGEASADFGIVVSEAPSFDRAKRKSTLYTVPGRNGAVIYQQNAYEDVTRSYKVFITADDLPAAINEAGAWLYSKTGYQRLEDSFEPDTYRLAYFNGVDFSNELMQYGEATLSFICRPERFYKDGEREIDIINVDTLRNPTRFESKPLIHVEGEGEITITVNGLSLDCNVIDYINIDSDRLNAYREETENMNGSVSGTFPVLVPGNNSISLTGNITAITLVPRYFTI